MTGRSAKGRRKEELLPRGGKLEERCGENREEAWKVLKQSGRCLSHKPVDAILH